MLDATQEETKPKRVQRRRTKGWKMPDGTVYVGRPTLWGNPFAIERTPNWPQWGGPAPWRVVADDGRTWQHDDDQSVIVGRAAAERHSKHLAATKAVALYRESLLIFEPDEADFWTPIEGRDLACWCPLDQPCHADVLLEIANRGVADG